MLFEQVYFLVVLLDDKYRGDAGPLKITELNFRPLNKEWLEAGRELGLPVDRDQNADQTSSFFSSQVNIDGGHRSSAYEEYIKPASGRRNLKTLCNAYVTKVLLIIYKNYSHSRK